MKIITGGQSGADLSGNFFAKKHNIETEINTFRGFKPSGMDELPVDDDKIQINYLDIGNGEYTENLRRRTEYNVIHSDFTIILLDRNIRDTRGSNLTLELCKKHKKPCYYVNIYTRDSVIWNPEKTVVCFDVDIAKRYLTYTKGSVLNIAGHEKLDRLDCIKFLEQLLGEYI